MRKGPGSAYDKWNIFVRHLKSRNKTERTIILQNKIKTKGKQILFILNETHFNKSFLFRFILDNIPAAPAYGVYISQLTRYSRPIRISM